MRKRKTVTIQLMSRIIPLVVLLMAVVIGVTINVTKQTVQEMAEAELLKEVYGNGVVLNKSISEDINSLEPVKDVLESVNFETDEEMLAYLETTMQLNESIPNGVYMGDDTNHYLDGSLWTPDSDYVVAERDWYKEGLTHENFTLGSPYLDADTGQMIVSISSKVNVPNWGTTVMVGDMFLDQISEFIEDLNVMEVGYSFVIDPENDLVIAHKGTQFNGMTMEEAGQTDEIIGYLAGVTNYESILDTVISTENNGETYMMAMEEVEGTNWYLVCCVSENVVMDELYSLLKTISMVGIQMLILIIVILAITIHRQMKPIRRLTTIIEGITSGDFTLEVVPTGNNEITTMSEKLRDFITTMRETIEHITEVSVQLGKQASGSADVSGVLSSAASVQSEAMGQMNSTVDDLAHSIENIADNANSLSEAVTVVFNNGTQAEEKVNETVHATEKGKTEIEKVAENMDKISASIETLSNTVREVGASTEEINNITEIIGDIAGQTNLLSLNASIEAARAGEAGRGFAVVADQIGKLANMSADAVKQIAALIGKINVQVADTVTQTGQSVEDIKESKELVDISYAAFMEIYEKVMMTDENIRNVTSKIREVEDVASSMAAITEEQSASTEEILATSENLYAQSQNIAENSHQIEDMAASLSETAQVIKERMQQFQV